jgi:hypothetical protein
MKGEVSHLNPAGRHSFQKGMGQRPNAPVVSVASVVGLAHPDSLAEVDAIAAMPL